MLKYEHFIFDFDGTLSDSYPAFVKAAKIVADKYNVKVTVEDIAVGVHGAGGHHEDVVHVDVLCHAVTAAAEVHKQRVGGGGDGPGLVGPLGPREPLATQLSTVGAAILQLDVDTVGDSLDPHRHLIAHTGLDRYRLVEHTAPAAGALQVGGVGTAVSHRGDDGGLMLVPAGQIALFKKNADRLSDSIGYRPMYHVLNSAGIERFPQYQFDMVRLGIGIYGVSAIPGNRLSPVASFKCKVLQVKTLKPGDGTIGYGRRGKISPEGTVIATIPVGYADGLDRHLSRGKGMFSVNGHRVPTIGNICMDMTMLDVTGIDAKVGDTVTIFGENPTVIELAEILDTIPYEIMTSVPRRIERIIVK